VTFLGINLNTSTPVALDDMEQTSNVRHCGRSLRLSRATGVRTLQPFATAARSTGLPVK